MPDLFTEPSRRVFMLKTIVPILVAAAVLIGGVGFIVSWSTSEADKVSTARQHRLVEVIVGHLRSRIAHEQESVTVSDDAVREVRARNLDWIDAHLGSWMAIYFGHDGAYVLDPSGQPVFALADGRRREPAAYDAIRATADPLVEDIRSRLHSGDTEGLADHVLTLGASDMSVVNGHPAIVSVKPIVSETGDIRQTAHDEFLHVAVRYLDGSLLEALEQDYLLDGLRFAKVDDRGELEASIPLQSASGSTLGYLIWRPFLPGAAVLKHVAPLLAAVSAAALVVLAILVAALRRRALKLSKSQAEVQHLATYDQLTGLLNRRQFELRLAQALGSLGKGDSLAVLYLDLDHFKEVNDTFGHQAGDALLQEFARRVTGIIRKTDVVARLGGDEFTILLQGIEQEDLEAICRLLIENGRRPFDVGGNQVFVGVSAGAAIAPRDGNDRVELTRRADVAMYHSKKAGRSAYSLYTEEMNNSINARRDIERDLRKALAEGGQFEVLYQPLYSAASSSITGVEALVRWNHPQRGLISPTEFIPVAEDSGLIEQLDDWVLHQACRTTKDWPIETLAVNVSALELGNPGFAIRVANTLMATGANPRRLELEVTESALTSQSGECERNIAALRELGVRFALDDFGTGFSSLGRLQQLDVDRIKIDRSFVQGFGNQGSDEAIVQAIVDLAKAAGLRTTAEGVETSSQGDYLRSIGCDELQGFLLSQPIPAADVERLWAEGRQEQLKGIA